jgi:hypothetical protein
MNHRIIGSQTPPIAALMVFAILAPVCMWAQRSASPAPQPPAGGRARAPIDVTGYWVSIISEDWRWRMVTPPKGDYLNVPLTLDGRRVADTYDPDKDAAAGDQCKAYGAPGIMRMPTRLHITWIDDNTMKIETDTGQQTRIIHFGGNPPSGTERTWQGYSVASWEYPGPQGRVDSFNPAFGRNSDRKPPPGGSLKIITTFLRAGYLRTNGAPYSENAVLTEYLDRHTDLGVDYITHSRILDDPQYLTEPYLVTSHFKREADGSKWDPKPCVVARPFK